MSKFNIVKSVTGNVVPVAEQHSQDDPDKEIGVALRSEGEQSDSEESTSQEAQAGVQGIEAMTSIWSRSHLIAAYVMYVFPHISKLPIICSPENRIWCIYFLNTIEQASTGALTPYVTSAFEEHSLTATTSIMSSIIGGLVQLPLSKVLDIWGRPQGYALMSFLLTMGLVMMAACNNVQTYAAAQVFYWVG